MDPSSLNAPSSACEYRPSAASPVALSGGVPTTDVVRAALPPQRAVSENSPTQGGQPQNGNLRNHYRLSQNPTTPGVSAVQQGGVEPCYNCGLIGHFAQCCPEPRRTVPAGEMRPANTGFHCRGAGRRPAHQLPSNRRSRKKVKWPYQHNRPSTTVWTAYPPHEKLQNGSKIPLSAYGQAYPQLNLPTPSSLNLSTNTSPVWPSEGYPPTDDIDHQNCADDDVSALDFPEQVDLTDAKDIFPIHSTNVPLTASTEVADRVRPLSSSAILAEGIPVSKYFQNLEDDRYYQNASKKTEWEETRLDPAFASIDADSQVVSFSELEARLENHLMNDEELSREAASKFDVVCLYNEEEHPTSPRDAYSDEQEAALAALGIVGHSKQAHPAHYESTWQSEAAGNGFVPYEQSNPPPWRRCLYSRYYPGPAPPSRELPPWQQQSNAANLQPQPSTQGTRKRSRSTDFFVEDQNPSDEPATKTPKLAPDQYHGEPGAQTMSGNPGQLGNLEPSPGLAHSQAASCPSTTTKHQRRHQAKQYKKGQTGDDPNVDPVYYRRW